MTVMAKFQCRLFFWYSVSQALALLIAGPAVLDVIEIPPRRCWLPCHLIKPPPQLGRASC